MRASTPQNTIVEVWRKNWLRSARFHSSGYWRVAWGKKKAGKNSARPHSPGPFDRVFIFVSSVTGSGRCLGLRVRLRHADIAADHVLASLVDHHFFGETRARGVEEDGLVESAILLFKALVFDGHDH